MMRMPVAGLLTLALLLPAGRRDATSEDQRAATLLVQARTAIGGGASLASIRSLSAAGAFNVEMPDGTRSSELAIDVQLPDKLLRTDTTRGFGATAFVMLRGVNGGDLVRRSKIVGGGPGARMSQPPLLGGSEAAALRSARADLSALALALLLTEGPTPLTFTYAGEATSPDGHADVIDAGGADGFSARLFLEKRSHRPLMVTYRGFDPRMFAAQSQPAPQSGRGLDANRGADTADAAASTVEIALYLDDYRAVGAVLLPHRITRAIAGATDEEWTFKTIKINPPFKADAFSIK